MRLQPTAKELKLEHLGSGDFLNLIGRRKVAAYLAWLKDQDFLIHYSVVDPIYWSTVDIIDAITSDDDMGHMMLVGASLKDDLYTVLRVDLDHLATSTAATATPASSKAPGRHSRPSCWISWKRARSYSPTSTTTCSKACCSMLPVARPWRISSARRQTP